RTRRTRRKRKRPPRLTRRTRLTSNLRDFALTSMGAGHARMAGSLRICARHTARSTMKRFYPRSQTPVWERASRNSVSRSSTEAKQSFADRRSQTGVWERGAKGPSRMMQLLSWLLAAALLVGLAAGCGGGDKDKGINNTKDRPKAADKGQEAP